MYICGDALCLYYISHIHAEYTIAVVGCTGRGKTTFCNYLFKEGRFRINNPAESQYSGWENLTSITSEAQHGVLEDPVAGVELYVIDTPGFLTTENRTGEGHADRVKDGRKLLEEFAKALTYVKDGIDVLFITLKTHARVSAEEEFLLEFLDGLRLWPYCVLLFTHGSFAGEKEESRYDGLYKFIETDRFKVQCPVVAKMMEKTQRRFVIVESVQQAGDPHYHRSKLDEIYGAINVVRKDAGSPVNHPLLEMARNAWETHQLILKKQSNFEEPKDTERIEKLVHSLNQHVLESHSSEHILAQHLVCYLSRMEGNPDSFVNAYSELVTVVEEQKKTKVKLQEELDELSRKGGLGRRKNIADSLNVILENPQPIDDTMPTSSANPRNRGNIQEDNVQAAPKRCTII